MAGGSKTASTSVTRYQGIQIQSSISGIPVAIGYGTNMVSPNILWYGNFVSKAVKTSSGGKGGGSSSTNSYTYSASIILGLGCQISGVLSIIRDQTQYVGSPLSALGFSLFSGAIGQTAWSYLTTNYPSQAIGYSGIAYVAAANYALSSSATLPNHQFEVQWPIRATVSGSLIADANPADIVTDFVTRVPYWVTSWLNTTSISAYALYCTAANLFLSPLLDQQRSASDFLTEILTATNSNCCWSDGTLKIVPYGDTTITNNGVTYTPNLTPIYTIDNTCLIPQATGEDPIQVNIASDDDAWNYIQVEYLQRSNQYNSQIATAYDQASIDTYGKRTNTSPYSLHAICDDTVAANVAQLIVQRTANNRRTFSFVLPWTYMLLDPMDIVQLNSGDLVNVIARITAIQESGDGNLEFTAEEVLVGTSHTPVIARQAQVGYTPNYAVAPGSVSSPLIVVPPTALTNNTPEVWIAVAGGANWGGCEVYASYDDVTFQLMGVIQGPARYGVTTSTLASNGDPDTTSSVGVDLTISAGTLTSGTQTDADNHTTLCLLGNEIISYETATLTATSKYTLGTYLRRGLYGTTEASQASGSEFMRLDSAVFNFAYRQDQIGKVVYLKFRSFNVFDQSYESLSAVTAYAFTLTTPTGGFTVVNWANIGNIPANLAALVGTEAINNALIAAGTNVVPNSDWTDGAVPPAEWFSAGPSANNVTGTGLVINSGRNFYSIGSPNTYYYGASNVLWTSPSVTSGSLSNSSYFFGWCQLPYSTGGSVAPFLRDALPCAQGDQIGIGGKAVIHGGNQIYLRVDFYDYTGTFITVIDVAFTGVVDARSGGLTGVNGLDANFYSASGIVTAPANSAFAIWAIYGMTLPSGNGANAFLFQKDPILMKMPAGVTQVPAYVPGMAVRSATIGATTSLNLYSSGGYGTGGILNDANIYTPVGTAAAVTGQTSWATYASLTPAQGLNPGANLVYNSSFVVGFDGWTNLTAGGGGTGSLSVNLGPLTIYHLNLPYVYFYGSGSATVSGNPVFVSRRFNVSASSYYSVSGICYAAGVASGYVARTYINFYQSDGVTIAGYSPIYVVAAGVGWSPIGSSFTAPSNAAYGVLALDLANTAQTSEGGYITPNGAAAWSELKVELGNPATPWNDAATNGALYSSGTSINALTPYQANSDQTSLNIASGFAGQGTLATGNYYEQSTDPGAVANGSLWADTTNTPAIVLKLRFGGAWSAIANFSTSSQSKFGSYGSLTLNYNTLQNAVMAQFTGLPAGGHFNVTAYWTLSNPQSSQPAPFGTSASNATGNWQIIEYNGSASHTLSSGTFSATYNNSGQRTSWTYTVGDGTSYATPAAPASESTMVVKTQGQVASSYSGSIGIYLQITVTGGTLGTGAYIYQNGAGIQASFSPT